MYNKWYVCVFKDGSFYKKMEDIFTDQTTSTFDIEKATLLTLLESEIVENKYGAITALRSDYD